MFPENYENNITKKIVIYHVDETWRLDLLVLKDSDKKATKSYKHRIFIFANFDEFRRCVPIRKMHTQKQSFSKACFHYQKNQFEMTLTEERISAKLSVNL